MQRCPTRKGIKTRSAAAVLASNTSFATDPMISNFTSDTLVWQAPVLPGKELTDGDDLGSN
jgi:acyl dehydratase